MFRILVVEDDNSARFLMCEVLRRAGYEPCPARDGVEASVKVKCFLGRPDAECTILIPTLNDDLRETESCRRQAARR